MRIKSHSTWSWQAAFVAAGALAFHLACAEGALAQTALDVPKMKSLAVDGHSWQTREKKPSRTAIARVRVSRNGQQIQVRVEGKGHLSRVPFRLTHPDRLVLDFSGALVRTPQKSIPSNVPPVHGVRISQFKPHIARLVVDLDKQVPYTFIAKRNVVTLIFRSSVVEGSDVAAKTVTDVAAVAADQAQRVPARGRTTQPEAPAAIAQMSVQDKGIEATMEKNAWPANTGTAELEAPPKEANVKEEQPSRSPLGATPGSDSLSAEPGQMYVEIRYNVDGTQFQGNRERSFLHEGVNHTAELSFFSNAPIGGIRRLEILGVGRYTNNPRVDPERNSLQRSYVRLTGPTFEANIGDALVNYSLLTFNQNIKGLNLWKNVAPRLRLTGTVGYFTDRWGSLYRDYTFFRDLTAAPNPVSPGKPYSRLVGGARLEQKFGRSNWLATNWSHGKDLLQSLPEATLACQDNTAAIAIRLISSGCLPGETEVVGFRRPFPEATNNDVLSADTSLQSQLLRLRLRGEFAYSWTSGGMPPTGANFKNFVCASQAPIVGADVLDSRCFSGQVGDWAGRLEANQRLGKLSWRVDYSRFQPNFFSANARQIRDLQEFNIRGEYELGRRVSLIGSWRRANDNLNALRNFTRLVRAPEVRLVFRELPFYRPLILEVGYRERNLDTSGTPGPTDFQKRSPRIPYLSLSLPFRSTQVSFDYEHRHEIDAVTPQLSTDTDRFALGYRARYTWGRWDFAPFVRFEIERLDKEAPRDAALAPTDLTLIFPGDFFSAFDTNRTIQTGFLLEAPRYFRIEGDYREFNGLALSPLRASLALNPQMGFLYLNQGFKRPRWRGEVTFKIANDENRTVTAFFERTNNFFATGDPFVPDQRSFRETVIGGTIVLRFRR